MRRRVFLGAAGSLASLGALRYGARDPVDELEIRYWLSRDAAAYAAVVDRVAGYLRLAFDREGPALSLSFGGVVDVSTEDAAAVTRDGEWPSRVVAGAAGRGDLRPARDVNLLVTDGQMSTAPTGYGIPHVASVGGARYVDALPPVDPDRTVLPYATPARVAQVIVHETGHALGLRHDHGTAYRRDDGVVVSTPMLGTYAWYPDYEDRDTTCGEFSRTRGGERALSFSFSTCARRRLGSYCGGLVP